MSPKPQNSTVTAKHYSIGQLRVDLWNRLKAASSELARADEDSPKGRAAEADVMALLDRLVGIEHYFGHPGIARVEQLRSSNKHHDRHWLAQRVATMVKDLVSDSYRGHSHGASDHEEPDTDEISTQHPSHVVDATYFEVLLVEDLTANEEQALRTSMRDLQQAGDGFTS